MIRARLSHQPFDCARLLAEFTRDLDGGQGAVVTFTGLTRSDTRGGEVVDALVLEHHPVLTAQSLQSIAEAGAARFPVSAIEVVHRCGSIGPRESIVWVAVASAHRRAAFEAADYLMDRLKTEAVFWKREERSDGSSWIEPTDSDYAERARWE